MTYVEGFLIPCPAANKAAYIAHAEQMADVFSGAGATRTVQSWGEDVPDGKLNDLKQAVQATPDEAILFSWMEFPDRAAFEHVDVAVAIIGNLPERLPCRARLGMRGEVDRAGLVVEPGFFQRPAHPHVAGIALRALGAAVKGGDDPGHEGQPSQPLGGSPVKPAM